MPPKLGDKRHAHRTTGDEGTLADAESSGGEDDDDDEEEDFNQYPEEARPIRARVKYKYPSGNDAVARSKSALERQQQELSLAVEEANTKAILGVGKRGVRASEPIGTRLTMTSRTGYFQDRIVSPSMVCASSTFIHS
jgi:hypothetical protein